MPFSKGVIPRFYYMFCFINDSDLTEDENEDEVQ